MPRENSFPVLKGTTATDIEDSAEKLAQLPALQYEILRKTTAKEFGISVGALDAEVEKRRPHDEKTEKGGSLFNEPEAWPHEVDGAELLIEIVGEIRKYVVLPSAAADAVALWILHTHVIDASGIAPILFVTSPAPACGKSTILALVESLSHKAIYAIHASTAALFRLIEEYRPTIILDECDTYLSENEELRGLIDGGHAPNGKYIRCDGDDNAPKAFATFCPKALGGIGKVHAAISSRAITIKLQRKAPNQKTEKLVLNRRGYLDRTKARAMRWALDNIDALHEITPATPGTLSDRSEDNWTPLCAIAELVGNGWVERAHKAAMDLEDADAAQSIHIKLLADIQVVFGTRDRISSKALAEDLATIETAPWPEYKNGKPISPKQIANLLSGFGIAPGTIRTPNGETAKGYYEKAFADSFARYLGGIGTDTTPQTAEIKAFSPNYEPSQHQNVTDRKEQKTADLLGCGTVTDQNPPFGGEEEIDHAEQEATRWEREGGAQ
jgi:putative DNA primase/helicase